MRDREQILEEALEAENAGNATTARRLYQECVNAHPKFAQAWLLYACFLHAQNEWSEAIKVAARIKGEPSAERAAMSLTGCCWKELGETTKAVEAFRASIRLDPKIYDFVFLGVALSELGRRDEAIKVYLQGLKLDPYYDELHFNLAYSYEVLRRYEKAEKHYRLAIEADPNYGRALSQLGHILTRRALKTGDYCEVKDLLRRGVTAEPDFFWGRIYLAFVYWWTNEEDAAEAEFLAAIELWPIDYAFRVYGEFLLDARNDSVKAETYFKRALKLEPESGETLYLYFRLLHGLKKHKRAHAYLVRAAKVGHVRAKAMLQKHRNFEKRRGQRTCSKCGSPLKRLHGGCAVCGSDVKGRARSALRRKPRSGDI